MNHTKLAEIYSDTQIKCITGHFAKFGSCQSLMYNSTNPSICALDFVPKFKTNIQVINEQVLDVVQQLVLQPDTNISIMVLNLASSYNPGGGVVHGAIAQEEDLFRKTNYFLSLPRTFYPIPKQNVIYTDKVYVVKDGNFMDLINPYPVSMLAAAAIKNPEIIKGRYTQVDYNIMKTTIENIFKVGYLHGRETLVLGALGCGAYRNPPLIVISIFNEYLKKYNGCFKNIVFAVYSKFDNNFDLFNKNIYRS
jgi:uncharacterized protein (TIGR02452 family)